MKLRVLVLTLLVMAGMAMPAAAQRWGRPNRPRDGACFFNQPNFRGDFFCMNAGERMASLPPGFNDRIMSIRVFGNAAVRIFNDEGFRGVNSFLRGDDARDLRGFRVPDNPYKNWADRISSIAVFSPDRDEWRNRRQFDWDDDRDREYHRDHPYPQQYR